MSPLKLALLLRAYSLPQPNRYLPEAQAFAPAMVEAVNTFRARGIVQSFVTTETMRHGWPTERNTYRKLLTEKGEALAKRILEVAAECYKEASE